MSPDTFHSLGLCPSSAEPRGAVLSTQPWPRKSVLINKAHISQGPELEPRPVSELTLGQAQAREGSSPPPRRSGHRETFETLVSARRRPHSVPSRSLLSVYPAHFRAKQSSLVSKALVHRGLLILSSLPQTL